MQVANHHTHSYFSDGRSSLEAYAKKAITLELTSLGFSDHAPIPRTGLTCMQLSHLPEYLGEIDNLKEKFAGQLQIYKALEVDYIPDLIDISSKHIVDAGLDYVIGAVHYVDHFADGKPWGFEGDHLHFRKGIQEIFNGDIKSAIIRYYTLIREMVSSYTPDIVAHLDRIKRLNTNNQYFDESTPWYREEVAKTLELMALQPCILEVNTKGFYKGEIEDTYPSKWILEIAKELNIPVHLASDAHHHDDLQGGFEFGLSQLKTVGYLKTHLFIDGCWQDRMIAERKIHLI